MPEPVLQPRGRYRPAEGFLRLAGPQARGRGSASPGAGQRWSATVASLEPQAGLHTEEEARFASDVHERDLETAAQRRASSSRARCRLQLNPCRPGRSPVI